MTRFMMTLDKFDLVLHVLKMVKVRHFIKNRQRLQLKHYDMFKRNIWKIRLSCS